MKQHQKISIIKNTEYLKWRYIENPDQYEIIGIEDTSGLEGIVVLKSTIRKGLKIGEIIDMLYLNDDLLIVKKLLKASLSYFREKNCVAVQSLAIKGTELERCYKKNGFFQRREIKFLFSPEALDERFYSPCDWYLTQGDGNDI